MLNLQSILTLVAVIGVMGALIALLWVRRLARRVERLSRSYWELRYEIGQLDSRVARLEPDSTAGSDSASSKAQAAFVPLSSLRNVK